MAKQRRKKTKENVIVQGYDISLNHGAVVQLCNGELDNFWYYTDLAGSAARSKEHGTRLGVPTKTKEPDKQMRALIRVDWIARWIDRVPLSHHPQFAGLEDYALRAEQGAHQLGEIGGQARRILFVRGVRLRLHDPLAVKMFVANDGTAHKELIEEMTQDLWGVGFSRFNPPKSAKGKQNRQTSEDLADAHGVAQMVWTEYQIRKGLIRIRDLKEKQIQVFNRATKANPVNILGREWLHSPDGCFASPRFESCRDGRCSLHVLDARGVLSEQAQRSIPKAVERISK